MKKILSAIFLSSILIMSCNAGVYIRVGLPDAIDEIAKGDYGIKSILKKKFPKIFKKNKNQEKKLSLMVEFIKNFLLLNNSKVSAKIDYDINELLPKGLGINFTYKQKLDFFKLLFNYLCFTRATSLLETNFWKDLLMGADKESLKYRLFKDFYYGPKSSIVIRNNFGERGQGKKEASDLKSYLRKLRIGGGEDLGEGELDIDKQFADSVFIS